jgi:hypothetical protein
MAVVKNEKEREQDANDFVKFMTKDELRKYHRGDEVYFTSKRLCEIFPDAKII